VPVVAPQAKSIEPTRHNAPPATEQSGRSVVSPTRKLPGLRASGPCHLLAAGTGWSGQSDAGATPATGFALSGDLGQEALRLRPQVPHLRSDDPPASKSRHGSHGSRSGHLFWPGASSSASTTSSASGSSGSGSGSGAAGMIVLAKFPVVSGAPTRVLMSPDRWRSVVLLFLLERPG
jgi:hypothetical protein